MKRILLSLLLILALPAWGFQVPTTKGTADVNYSINEGLKNTYSVSVVGVTPVATATDFIVLTGSATTTVRVTKVKITGASTAVGALNFYLIKRTAADTGGTAAAQTITAYDSNSSAATAVCNLYSANPTGLGAGTNLVVTRYIMPTVATSTFPAPFYGEYFGDNNGSSVVLRGVSQSLAINLAGQAIPAGTVLNVTIEFTEE